MNQTIEVPKALGLEDLHVGQRFTSGSYHMNEDRIKAFAEFRLPRQLKPSSPTSASQCRYANLE
jgi:hypothetical protein